MNHDSIEFTMMLGKRNLAIRASANVYRDYPYRHSVRIDNLMIDVYEAREGVVDPSAEDDLQVFRGDFTDQEWALLERECEDRFVEDLEEREREAS